MRLDRKKLKHILYSTVGLALLLSVFMPPILVGFFLELYLLPKGVGTIVALFVTLILMLVVAFNLDKLDPIMKKWRTFCGVNLDNSFTTKKVMKDEQKRKI